MPEELLKNPYVVGQSLKDDYGFYGRQNLVDLVIQSLTTIQQNAIVLHGQRRIGKTSLLHRLRRDKTLRQTHLPIFFDMQRRPGFHLARILADLTEILSSELDLKAAIPPEETLTADHALFRREILPEVYQQLGDRKLLILFDEFDLAVPSDIADRYPADSLLGFLQALMSTDDHQVAFVFVVSERLELLAEGYRRLFRSARTEPVGRLSQPEADELLTELGALGHINFKKAALERVWYLTNGHPLLTQLIGSEVFERLRKQNKQNVFPDDVEASLETAMAHGLGALNWFWTGLDREEQLVLAAIAELTEQQPSSNVEDVDKILQHYMLYLNDSGRRRACKQLAKHDFLIDTGGQHYIFAVELIRRWIVKNHSLKKVKDQTEEGAPEAQQFYREGSRNHQEGKLDEAIKSFRQAIKIDPHFARVHVDLARTLRAGGELDASLREYEEAHNLDPRIASEELIDVRLDYIRKLDSEKDEEVILTHAKEILRIDPKRLEARKKLSNIYLKRAGIHLENFKSAEALESLTVLGDPWQILQDPGVDQRVRKLWLDYSEKLTKRKPPRWDEAQEALNQLDTLGLLDEKTSLAFNHIILEKARIDLERDSIEKVIDWLELHLKDPLPTNRIKEMLYAYKERQIEQQRWPQAVSALEGLYKLINDVEIKADLLELYVQYGDILLASEKYNEASNVYLKGDRHGSEDIDFKYKVCDTYLRQASWYLDRDELADAETYYKKSFEVRRTTEVQEQASHKLEEYFHDRQREQDWQRASSVLQLLKNLSLSPDKAKTWQTTLYLAQANAELRQRHPDIAFDYLAKLGQESNIQVKSMIKEHLQQEALNEAWEDGAGIANRLSELLPDDQEVADLRANWLFSWVQAISGQYRLKKDLTEAKSLCQEILEITADAEDMPLFGLLDAPETRATSDSMTLRLAVCHRLAHILLEQAQAFLDQDNLADARTAFEETLQLPYQPDDLGTSIRDKLESYSENQICKENWENGQNALETILALKIGGQEISQLLITNVKRQAEFLFKANQPESAFSILHHLKADIKNSHRLDVEKMAYRFSRLYAGQTCWQDARRALQGLAAWLAPEDPTVMVEALDLLNHEELNIVRGKRLATCVLKTDGTRTLSLLLEEVRTIERCYADAENNRELTPDAPAIWVQHFIDTYLDLGKVYLANQDVPAAIREYQKILECDHPLLKHHDENDPAWTQHQVDVSLALADAYLFGGDLANANNVYRELLVQDNLSASQHVHLREQVSLSLYNYSEINLEQAVNDNNWDKTRSALDQLKILNLPSPYGELQTDPRVDGAIQRVMLFKAKAQLQENRVEEAFIQLKGLPTPLIEREIKESIFEYSDTQRQQKNWEYSIAALKHLDQLLADYRDQVRDQDTLEKLVYTLVQWGQYLEEAEDFVRAAKVYQEVIEKAQDSARNSSLKLAAHFIRVTFQLAESLLDADSLDAEEPAEIEQAIKHFKKIVALPQHQVEDEQRISKLLNQHAQELANRSQWSRVYKILDALYNIYGDEKKGNERILFATERWEFVLDEMKRMLLEQQVDSSFSRLAKFKKWLDKHHNADVVWTKCLKQTKQSVDQIINRDWLPTSAYAIIVQTLVRLNEVLPTDSEVIGWQVNALYEWGQQLHQRGDLSTALERYQQALEKVHEQELVSTHEIETRQVETLLAQAERHLNPTQPDLVSATELYRQILLKRSDNLDPTLQIRQALHRYSDGCVQQVPSNWEDAHKALNQLGDLNLHNKQVTEWKCELTLKEMDAKLRQDNINDAFASLEALERPWPIDDIKNVVHQYWQTRLAPNTWRLAIESLVRLGHILAEDAETRQWVVDALIKLGQRLNAQDDPKGAEEAFKAAVSFS